MDENKTVAPPQPKTYAIKIFDNQRIAIIEHGNNLLWHDRVFKGRASYKWNEFMSTKEYFHLIRRWYFRLFSLKIDETKCKWFTLTLENLMDYNQIELKFTALKNTMRRHFGNFKIIRGIEIQSCHNYHIHAIVEFENKPTDTQFNRAWLNKYWPWGFSYIEKNGNVHDVDGLLQYLTLFDENVEQKKCSGATYFPHGAKIITSTCDFADKEEFEISKELHDKIVQDYERLGYTDPNQRLTREDGHLYFSKTEQKTKYCIDKRYVFSNPEYINSIRNEFMIKNQDQE